ncbi:ankyrin repeat domain-containing protein [Holosporaceae bacterium 'Namur']|nr:ankyrin repeat domain-containing protein [Holosporaceae bacterium 'Namur']
MLSTEDRKRKIDLESKEKDNEECVELESRDCKKLRIDEVKGSIDNNDFADKLFKIVHDNNEEELRAILNNNTLPPETLADIVNSYDREGNTLLHLTVQKNNSTMVYALLKAGADCLLLNRREKDEDRRTPFDLAENNSLIKKMMCYSGHSAYLLEKARLNNFEDLFREKNEYRNAVEWINEHKQLIQRYVIGTLKKIPVVIGKSHRLYENNDDKKVKLIIVDIIERLRSECPVEEQEIWFKDRLRVKIKNLCKKYIEASKYLLESSSPSIIWGKPKPKYFIYSGSTEEKTVSIPFYEIHKQLIEANRIMEVFYSNKNQMVAHLLFIVSNNLYIKEENQKYNGGRIFIDFPFVIPMSTLLNQKPSEEDDKRGYYLHEDTVTEPHSEDALISYLKSNASNIALILKDKIKPYISEQQFKLYSVNLFISSQNNVCEWCEPKLSSLMTSINPDSFLNRLKEALGETVSFPRKNEDFPRMLISVSSHKEFGDGYKRIKIHASNAKLQPDKNLFIDSKRLAGSAILGIREEWVEENTGGTSIDKSTAPCYTGFISNNKDEPIKVVWQNKFKNSRSQPQNFYDRNCSI